MCGHTDLEVSAHQQPLFHHRPVWCGAMTVATREVCNSILEQLRLWFILRNLQKISTRFEHIGFPISVGVIHGTHQLIVCPSHQASDYINCKGFFSAIFQVVVDHQGCFTNISFCLGLAHNAHIFGN